MSSISGSWTLLASSDRLKRSSQILCCLGSQITIFGGELVARQPIDNQIDSVELASSVDSTKNSKIHKAPTVAPSPRVGSAAAVINGKVYMFSGRGGIAMAPIEEHGAVWQYDSGTEGGEPTWTPLVPSDASAPYPAARSYHAAASDDEKTFYIHAGCPEAGRLSDLWSFNIATRVWTELASAPDPPRGGTSIALSKGKIYRANGFDGTTEQGGALDIFDIVDNTWSTITYKPNGLDGPEPRSVGTLLALTIQGKEFLLTVFGEGSPSDLGHAGAGKMFSDCWAFDVEGQRWTKVNVQGGPPASRGWFAADVAIDENGKDVVVVHGGLAENNDRLGDVWKLEIDE